MSISKYQVFLKTVSCGSFSKAAEAMNFTQSGISHAINSLENELGVKLLSRNRGGVVLTADGRGGDRRGSHPRPQGASSEGRRGQRRR